MYNDKNNKFSLLYISDNEDDEDKPLKEIKRVIINKKKHHECIKVKNIKFTHKKKYYDKYKTYNNILDKYILEIEKSINKINNNEKEIQNITKVLESYNEKIVDEIIKQIYINRRLKCDKNLN